MAAHLKAKRRQHSVGLKAQVLGECEAPSASVAKVVMSHGITANIVHGWRQLARGAAVSSTAAAAVPAQACVHRQAQAQAEAEAEAQVLPVLMAPAALQAGSAESLSGIKVEVRRGAVTSKLTWPVCALADLAAWTREVLA